MYPKTPKNHQIPSPSLNSFDLYAFSTISLDNSELLQQFKSAYDIDLTWKEAIAAGSSDFRVESGLVFHKGRLYVPPPLRLQFFHNRHDSVLAGHPGRTRTTFLVSRDYSWPGLSTYVKRYVQACDTCARMKTPRHKPYGLLQPLEIPDRPWKALSMDFIVKLPLSHGYDSILVVCDRLTRAATFLPCCESMTAGDLAWLFLDRVFRHHGLPQSIVSDCGSVFVSNFWQELCKLLQIDVRTSTAYHPQTDGLTERTNQTLKSYLRSYCSYNQDDWVDYLPLAEFAFNSLENSSTKITPFFANLGYNPSFEPVLADSSSVPAAADLADRLGRIHDELKAELERAQATQAHYANRKRSLAPVYPIGRLVWLLRRNIRTTRPSLKLDHHRLGPYRVVSRVGEHAYRLALPDYLSRLHPVFHVSLLEPYDDPSEFHPHSTPKPVTLEDPATSIHSILDCRRVGRRFEYLVHYHDTPPTEDSWIPLYDIPTHCMELLDHFHRRHPRAPRPHPIVFSTNVHSPSPMDNDSVSISPRNYHPRSSTPPLHVQRLHVDWEPPLVTTTRSGRQSRPPRPFLSSSS